MNFYLKIGMAICCFLYILLGGYCIGEAKDYEEIGRGLAPFLAYPLAVVCIALAAFSYFLFNEFSDDEITEQEHQDLVWPILDSDLDKSLSLQQHLAQE